MPCGERHGPTGVADVAVHIHAGQRAGRVVRERLRGITVLVRVLVMAPMAAGAAIGALALVRVFVPAFMLAQLVGGVSATLLFKWLVPALPKTASDVLVPHDNSNPRITD